MTTGKSGRVIGIDFGGTAGQLLQDQTAMETQMLQQTEALCDGKDSLAQLHQRLDKM
jgi:hypothetical protein